MADKRISQLVERVTLLNNDVFPIVASGATTTNKVTLQTIDDYLQTNLDFGVTSVAMTVPTGLSVTGTPITSTGTFVVTFTAGYSIPTNAKQTQWDTAYSSRIISVTAPITFTSNVVAITQSGASSDGYLSSTDWNTFNNKQAALTFGNLTEATSSVLTITGGTGAVIGAGTSVEVKQASGSQDGFLDSADWTTFNNKQNALSGTGIVKSTGGTITYLTDNTSNWDSAYNDKINSAAVTGTTTKTLTLTQQDGGTITTTWTDLDTGTVTSVGVSMPSAFSVANSPITSSGTIAITGAGTTAQYIDGTGALQTFPNIISQATNLVTEVYNNSGATLSKGTVVYITGGQGNLPTISKALATGDLTSAQTYGVVQTDITNMNNGYVVVAGRLIDLDTQAYSNGTQLYLSSTTAGAWTSTKQYAPDHLVYVGIVVRSHPTQGVVEVKIQNGYEMDELHDVSAQNPNNNDILQYKTATGLWTKTAGTTTNIAEGTNLYYTNDRARAAFSESVTGLDYDSITGVLSTTTGYAIPTTASQTNWDAAYNDKINSAAVTGTTTKTLTLTQQDGGTITASWTDDNTDAVTSVFGRTGAVVATEGDYNLGQLGDVAITTPTNGQFLKYDGTSWINAAAGTVTSVALATGTTGTDVGVTGSPITGAGTITLNIPIASATNTGKLSSTDWSTFNGKQAALNGTGFVKISGTTISYDNSTYVDTSTNQSIGGNKTFLNQVNVQPVSSTSTIFNAISSINSASANPVLANIGASWIPNANNQTFSGLYISAANPSNPSGYTGLTTYALQTSGNVKIGGTLEATGNITGANLSGTNTGDQTLAGLGGVPTSRTLTINGTALDLSADRSWSVGTVTGSGTDNYLPKWSGGGTSLTNSVVTDDGERINIQGVGTLLGGGWRANQLNTAIYPVVAFRSTATPDRYAGIGYEAAATSGLYFWVNGTSLSNITSNWSIYLKNDDRSFNTYGDATIGATLRADQIRLNDGKYIYLGNSQDLNLHHNGTDSYIQNSTGQLILRNYTYDGITIDTNGAVKTANTLTSTDVFYVGTNGNGGGTWTWGGTDAYIYSPATKHLHLSSGSNGATNGIHIATNGNVTIGGTEASQKLRVNGTAYSTFNIVQSANATGEIGYFRGSNFGAAYGTDTNGAYLLSSYWVSAANSALSIKTTTSTGAQDTRGIFEYVTMSGGWNRVLTLKGQYPILGFLSTDGNKYAGIGYDASGGGQMVIKAGATTADIMTGQTLATIGNDGQWTYGTGSASWKLFINETSNKGGENGILIRSGYYPAIRFEGINGVASNAKIVINTFATGYGASSLAGSFLLQADNAMQFSTGGDNVRVTITSGGRVAIGSTTSNYSLYANGTICAGYVLLGDTGNGANSTVEGLSGNGNTTYANLHIQYYASGYLSLNNGGGNCYIGALATADDYNYKLSVAGTIHATGDVIAYSDISVKKNIRPIENVLERVTNSRGVVYDRVDNDDKNNIGFIAQELEKQFPELVNTNANGTKGVKYQNAVAILFEAVKEQQKQIDELKKQVA